MKNGIKFSTAETGALRVNGANLAPTQESVENSQTYWTSIQPPVGGYTIYLNKETNGPAIYIAADDATLISLANYLERQSFTTIEQVLVWYSAQSGKFVVNIEYPSITTKGIMLNLDAGFIPSYRRSGTTWSDLSGNGYNATLVNGPVFNTTTKDSIIFDGTNDYAETGGVAAFNTDPFSISVWFKTDGSQTTNSSIICVANVASSTNWQLSFTSNILVFFINSNTSIATNYTQNDELTNIVVARSSTSTNGLKIYMNGVLDITATANTNFTDSSGIRLGMNRGSNSFFKGEIQNVLLYNRALTETEVMQNYNAFLNKIPAWILENGLWEDSKIWVDTENWKDI